MCPITNNYQSYGSKVNLKLCVQTKESVDIVVVLVYTRIWRHWPFTMVSPRSHVQSFIVAIVGQICIEVVCASEKPIQDVKLVQMAAFY